MDSRFATEFAGLLTEDEFGHLLARGMASHKLLVDIRGHNLGLHFSLIVDVHLAPLDIVLLRVGDVVALTEHSKEIVAQFAGSSLRAEGLGLWFRLFFRLLVEIELIVARLLSQLTQKIVSNETLIHVVRAVH